MLDTRPHRSALAADPRGAVRPSPDPDPSPGDADDDAITAEMVRLLTRCLGARALRARRDDLGLSLRPEESHRLREFEHFLDDTFGARAVATAFEADTAFPARADERRPVQLRVEFREADGSVRDGVIRDVSPGGIYVVASRVLRPGTRTPFRFIDPDGGKEWQFAGEVAWTNYGPDAGMGLRFLGIPVEIHLGRRASGPGGASGEPLDIPGGLR